MIDRQFDTKVQGSASSIGKQYLLYSFEAAWIVRTFGHITGPNVKEIGSSEIKGMTNHKLDFSDPAAQGVSARRLRRAAELHLQRGRLEAVGEGLQEHRRRDQPRRRRAGQEGGGRGGRPHRRKSFKGRQIYVGINVNLPYH